MNLRVFTAQYNYNGEERLDTTVKTGANFLAPTWDIVMGHKSGQMSDEEYTQRYLHMLNVSMQNNPDLWVALLRRRKVVLICFCGTAKCFCHRYALALFLEKLGAKYVGEINTRTNVLIPRDRFLNTVLNADTQEMIRSFVPEKKSERPLTTSLRPMVVDPLAINTIQSSTCRDCKDNRAARAWTPRGNVHFQIVEHTKSDEELKSRNIACCANTVEDGAVTYDCPIFKGLIDAYRAGVTSQGTNINPCKNCTEHVDNGGNCFGDRCPDGRFPIIPGAGLVKV
jgi:hypothetical protein